MSKQKTSGQDKFAKDLNATASNLASALTSYFLTVKAIVTSPREFFQQMDKDGGWLEPFIFFLTSAAINAFLGVSLMLGVVHAILASVSPGSLELFSELNPLLLAFVWFQAQLLCMIAGSFILSFAITIAMHFLGGTGNFLSTYRVLSCCWVVLLVSWIPVIGGLLGLYFFVPAWFGLSKAHELDGWKALLGVFAGTFAATVVAFLLCLPLSAMHAAGPDSADSLWQKAPKDLLDQYRSR
jgi:hypothetical protein